MDRPSPVWIRVHDIKGRLVRTLERGTTLSAGSHAVTWDGRDDAGRLTRSGMYFYEFETGGDRIVRRMVRLR